MPRLVLMQQTPMIQDLERSFVRRNGFELITGTTGRELLRKTREMGADLVIAPIMMPELSGIELCTLLRASIHTASIPVLLFGPEAERVHASSVGARGFLPTPLTGRNLVGAVREFFALEDRGASRAPVSLRVVCSDGPDTYVAFTLDISATGVFLKGALPAEQGARLRLRMRLPGDPTEEEVDLLAEVVRCVKPDEGARHIPGVGVRFLDFPLIRKVPITRFVREHRAQY